jgi:hypothetical protein
MLVLLFRIFIFLKSLADLQAEQQKSGSANSTNHSISMSTYFKIKSICFGHIQYFGFFPKKPGAIDSNLSFTLSLTGGKSRATICPVSVSNLGFW